MTKSSKREITATKAVVSAAAVRTLQRRVAAFAATGATSHAPTYYHR
ncbi:hypothetical protein ACFOSC_27780 [Streptantibioticus rubrisoli]|uniref:Uncharacterized protein n=1 Tax=Streptantibioticus rubrisoli TaxID=1387313 RepID=A0ABT1PKA1_9ACTN|nr:hypothetical protein [Streptantibioticus rubrisoli]MCQ4045786.1 hypothetical protein [Streptantibioticus rubrisoli]